MRQSSTQLDALHEALRDLHGSPEYRRASGPLSQGAPGASAASVDGVDASCGRPSEPAEAAGSSAADGAAAAADGDGGAAPPRKFLPRPPPYPPPARTAAGGESPLPASASSGAATTPARPAVHASSGASPSTAGPTPDHVARSQLQPTAASLAVAAQSAAAAVGAAQAAQAAQQAVEAAALPSPCPPSASASAPPVEAPPTPQGGGAESVDNSALGRSGDGVAPRGDGVAPEVARGESAPARLAQDGVGDEFDWRAGADEEEEGGGGPLDDRVEGAIDLINRERDGMNEAQLQLDVAKRTLARVEARTNGELKRLEDENASHLTRMAAYEMARAMSSEAAQAAEEAVAKGGREAAADELTRSRDLQAQVGCPRPSWVRPAHCASTHVISQCVCTPVATPARGTRTHCSLALWFALVGQRDIRVPRPSPWHAPWWPLRRARAAAVSRLSPVCVPLVRAPHAQSMKMAMELQSTFEALVPYFVYRTVLEQARLPAL